MINSPEIKFNKINEYLLLLLLTKNCRVYNEVYEYYSYISGSS